ncbi:hypothetical protein SNOG_16424 [Parastagonospora nodorum SN15]|uniref:Uncharacterized protein n=1 Tax=Phaeosphaeria nodorum (strain SN15 / ATCC MYA-4574 / FGSC 10173) TaxID=321614 RepID=Q0TVU8_PHANO|nr:hypothetical protein SNOG_16424 [Parastagonospora nodorum SN15]EAT76249.1 hypothetical protein SNOG_16424 [Parastagonospora nodorum SN15]
MTWQMCGSKTRMQKGIAASEPDKHASTRLRHPSRAVRASGPVGQSGNP